MAIDRTRPLKIESVAGGGSSNDESITEVNVGQDYLDCNGVALQVPGARTSTADSACTISRPVSGSMAFTDPLSGTLLLEQLLTSAPGLPGSHASTPDILHWVGAPGDGFASGAYRQTVLQGLLPATITWWASSAMTVPLFQTTHTYAGILCVKRVHTLYAAGVSVRTLTESISYATSVFAPAITRTWS